MRTAEDLRNPFWDHAAEMYLASLIGYVMECLPEREHTLEYAAMLFTQMHREKFDKPSRGELLFQELGLEDPDSFAWQKYQMYKVTANAERMHASILGVLAEKLAPLTYDGPLAMYRKAERVDFAANTRIPDFDNIISVIRSREIYVSIIIQSISQLNALYGPEKAKTIINNCDNCLYLGGQDVETARYIGVKANRTADTILNMPLEEMEKEAAEFGELPGRPPRPAQRRRADLTGGRNVVKLI